MSSHDTIVIGAGLAGLRCATLLADAGRDVVVLEAGDA
ncbi:MAG: FAD-binding protein, partial [Actinobacteria bacterium]|nr:FAD-binding protein [Actinomycetota bacterium]